MHTATIQREKQTSGSRIDECERNAIFDNRLAMEPATKANGVASTRARSQRTRACARTRERERKREAQRTRRRSE